MVRPQLLAMTKMMRSRRQKSAELPPRRRPPPPPPLRVVLKTKVKTRSLQPKLLQPRLLQQRKRKLLLLTRSSLNLLARRSQLRLLPLLTTMLLQRSPRSRKRWMPLMRQKQTLPLAARRLSSQICLLPSLSMCPTLFLYVQSQVLTLTE
jgi:hypothetical protein